MEYKDFVEFTNKCIGKYGKLDLKDKYYDDENYSLIFNNVVQGFNNFDPSKNTKKTTYMIHMARYAIKTINKQINNHNKEPKFYTLDENICTESLANVNIHNYEKENKLKEIRETLNFLIENSGLSPIQIDVLHNYIQNNTRRTCAEKNNVSIQCISLNFKNAIAKIKKEWA